ncbi:hypothetical protein P152DRAFT_18446 [Eremomyces bilateralis CBS 781.70]|uniref:C2H2-type domain-containing protein n=1 Tax=Eremomyces bilateralis CBS 781.70 TaxID=1392243 RepID=A0A6G1GHC6_9PEZI|nr:uncharacterized protein P152DRAFT_18446 [Eremomyces bilateralis CBS 781.70]KAF1817414.1 hypothetical protein P152DRAFT_18446 [Eremomyces bilateralis CBS 781.70]
MDHQLHHMPPPVAPKRTASGSIRPNNRSVSEPHQDISFPIPPEVAPHLQALRRFDLEAVIRWITLDRQQALNNVSPGATSQFPHGIPHHQPRLSVASSIGRQSTTSSIFSAPPGHRQSISSANTNFTVLSGRSDQFSPAGEFQQWNFEGPTALPQVPLASQQQPQRRNPMSPTAAPMSQTANIVGIPRSSPRPAPRSDPEKKQKYVCTSCEVKFTRRWDWKHHEETVHERWRKFPCPDCNQEFWSENSFNQHHKSAHNCKNCPHATSVKQDLEKRTAWGCGFCAAIHYAWEERCKHVATHFDKGESKDDWKHSNVIYGLLHQPDLLEAWRALLIFKHGQFPDPQPCFSWKAKVTGRQQGFRESGCGQLQDLLEFARTKESVQSVVQMAYDNGILQSTPPVLKLQRRNSNFPIALADSPQAIKSPQMQPRTKSEPTPSVSPPDDSPAAPTPTTSLQDAFNPVQVTVPANADPSDTASVPMDHSMSGTDPNDAFTVYFDPNQMHMNQFGGPLSSHPSGMPTAAWAQQQHLSQSQHMHPFSPSGPFAMGNMAGLFVDKDLPPLPPHEIPLTFEGNEEWSSAYSTQIGDDDSIIQPQMPT